jgi:hypothetical protein
MTKCRRPDLEKKTETEKKITFNGTTYVYTYTYSNATNTTMTTTAYNGNTTALNNGYYTQWYGGGVHPIYDPVVYPKKTKKQLEEEIAKEAHKLKARMHSQVLLKQKYAKLFPITEA